MNKYQESLNLIIKNSCHKKITCKECDFEKYCNSIAKEKFDNLQELVDKATPKKPLPNKKIEKGKYITWNCPNCNKYISSGYYYPPLRMAYNHNYCGECGQKLDWSDEK